MLSKLSQMSKKLGSISFLSTGVELLSGNHPCVPKEPPIKNFYHCISLSFTFPPFPPSHFWSHDSITFTICFSAVLVSDTISDEFLLNNLMSENHHGEVCTSF